MLHYNTVVPLLKETLELLMSAREFSEFRLVGGTALSLYRGHRMSIDIDLFTDANYDSVDFKAIDGYLRKNFAYVDTSNTDIIGMGKSYFIGNSAEESIKLDLYYTDAFINDAIVAACIRIATIEDIIAMKLDVVQRNGRKKDFWDIHELHYDYTIEEMFALHLRRYPYTHNRKLLITQFTNFDEADGDFEPDCLRGKHWELIKLDMVAFINTI